MERMPGGSRAEGLPPPGLAMAPKVEVAVRSVWRGAGVAKPGMAVAGGIEHQVEKHPHPATMCFAAEPFYVGYAAEVGMDSAVVGRVIAVVARRGEDGSQPESVYAEI